jgi:hypothetical protein
VLQLGANHQRKNHAQRTAELAGQANHGSDLSKKTMATSNRFPA